MVKSLNELYQKNEIFYWCNATGDPNMPGDPRDKLIIHHPGDVYPPSVYNLYCTYWSECYSLNCYVVSLRGRVGMALTALYDDEFPMVVATERLKTLPQDEVECMERLPQEKVNELWFKSVMEFAELVDARGLGCEIYVGQDTDPLGHEVLLFFPVDTDVEALHAFTSFIDEKKVDMYGEEFKTLYWNRIMEYTDTLACSPVDESDILFKYLRGIEEEDWESNPKPITEIVRALWTAYCLKNGLVEDTAEYAAAMDRVFTTCPFMANSQEEREMAEAFLGEHLR